LKNLDSISLSLLLLGSCSCVATSNKILYCKIWGIEKMIIMIRKKMIIMWKINLKYIQPQSRVVTHNYKSTVCSASNGCSCSCSFSTSTTVKRIMKSRALRVA
jgi:hypothetical protein